MDLKQAFQQAAIQPPRKTLLDGYRDSMSQEDATALDNALSSTLSHVDIARVLTAQGMPIGEKSIRKARERVDMQVNGL